MNAKPTADPPEQSPRTLDGPPESYPEAVRLLADLHASTDSLQASGSASEKSVYVLPDLDAHEVRLVLVSEDFPSGVSWTLVGAERSESPVVRTFAIGPSEIFPFPSAVAHVRRDEWEDIRSGKLLVDRDWDVASAVLYEPSECGVPPLTPTDPEL